jgi:hypothetical protein
VERDDFELVTQTCVGFIEFFKLRQTAARAGPSPEPPEFEKHPFAFEIAELEVLGKTSSF